MSKQHETEGAAQLMARTDDARREANTALDESRRSELGQFMTPEPIARFMASMFKPTRKTVRLLDAGAGVGSLAAAFVAAACAGRRPPASIEMSCYEVDPVMLAALRQTSNRCADECDRAGVPFAGHVIDEDFISAGTALLNRGSFGGGGAPRFSAAILNPPYRNIHSASRERALLRSAGIETSNLYTAFVGLAVKLLEPGGQLVAITPRSFCNGPYFQPFRELLLGESSLLQVHVFESRNRAFRDDDVLQENVIFHVRKGAPRGKVILSTSSAPGVAVSRRAVPHDLVVDPTDPNAFIHLAVSEADAAIADRMRRMPCTLADIGLQVSTGRVVDFRVKAFLRPDPGPGTVPLIYPMHFDGGFVAWPKLGGRKANALTDGRDTQALMVPNETFVLTRRFSSKEERRRVVAVVYDPERIPGEVRQVGFENHLNYFHQGGAGLPRVLARGLAAYLNTTLLDQFFRQFNGHTQVNAGDLRSLRYPTRDQLRAIGRKIGNPFPDQQRIDHIVDSATA